MKFRRMDSTDTVEAIRWNGNRITETPLPEWIMIGMYTNPCQKGFIFRYDNDVHVGSPIGIQIAKAMDWIIHDQDGNTFVMSPAEFSSNFEEITEDGEIS